jgi:hypothetical protein
MVFFFPEEADNAKEKEYAASLKNRTLIILRGIVSGANVSSEVEQIDAHLFRLFKPKRFTGRDGSEAKHVTRYEEVCAAVAQSTGRDPKRMTTREFFYTLQLMRKQAKNMKRGQSNQGKRSISG